MARTRITLAVLGIALLLPSAPARAQDGWLDQELTRLTALPHSLQAARDNAWLQVSKDAQRVHNVPEDAYRAVRPRLDALASAARPDLERELDGILSSLRFDDLQATSMRQPLSYCGWIGTARPDGMLPSPSDLQATLTAHCRTMAAGVVSTLLDQHADALDLTLPALPRLDLDFPPWLLADLARPDDAGTIALDPARLQAAYQDRLARRITAAVPGLRSDIDRSYAARTWTGGPIASPETDCRRQLGPLASGQLGTYCRDVATRWITAQLPAMQRALPGAVTAALSARPTLDENGLCRIVLSPWLPDSLPSTIQGAATAACLPEAKRAIAQAAADRAQAIAAATDARVTQLAAPILAAPRSYDSLRAHQWFAQAPTSWDGILPLGDPATPAVRDQAKAEYLRRIAPSSDAALADARQQIEAAFQQAAGRASAIHETQRLCGLDGNGAGLPPAPAVGSLRDQVVALCIKANEAYKLARVRIALERAGVRPDDKTTLIVAADPELRLLLPAFVARAALAGLQIRTTSGVLGFGARLLVTPMGADKPTLSGSVSRSGQGLLLSGIDPLPGWPGDTLDTVLCLVANEDELLNAQFSALLTMMGSFFAYDDDRPRTGRSLMRDGLSQLQDVQSRRACLAARQAFIDQAPGG